MTPLEITLLALGALGHLILWVAAVNRLHAVNINRKLMDSLTLLCGMAVALLPLAVFLAIRSDAAATRNAAWIYVALCAAVCIAAVVRRVHAILHPERRGVVLSNHTSLLSLSDHHDAPFTAPGIPTWLARLPGNEILQLHVHEKQISIPRLAPGHDGVRIVHLSDLHMSGRITKAYFEHVAERVNAVDPDIIAITGDIVERNQCLDWIPDTLGRLRATSGVYYVLGNHDKKVDRQRLSAALSAVRIQHVGGLWKQIEVRGLPLVIAGNELPWFGPAADLTDCPPHDAEGLPLRVMLTHTPDRINWARDNGADLVLAGHNHGGQIRLPIFGAITSPSLHGVRYAAGAFRCGNTVLHVSRGTASYTPFRWNCPPEIAVLVLRSA